MLTEPALASLCASLLCRKAPKQKVLTEISKAIVVRWNGKKWVKTKEKAEELMGLPSVGDMKPDRGQLALDYKTKIKEVSQPVVIDTLEKAETWVLASEADNLKAVIRAWNRRADDPLWRTRIAMALGLSVNIGSTNADGDSHRFLYNVCEQKATFKKVRGRNTDKLSTDQNALDAMFARSGDERVLWCLQLRRLRMIVSDMQKESDEDGRFRSSISLVKETGRMAASKSPLGTGTNLQALNRDLLYVLVADEGMKMTKFDLEGADSWTVAAECAALGDRTMLEDLLAGLKPAKILCLLSTVGLEANNWPREKIKATLKTLEMPEWLYPSCKAAVHGSSYGMGLKTMQQSILKNSLSDLPATLQETKPMKLTMQQVEALQQAFLFRYPGIKKWHEKEGNDQLTKGYITTSAGHTRYFYGRKSEFKDGQKQPNRTTLMERLASKPQFYTTYATKLALGRLWNDPRNRTADGSLVVEPLMVRHDEILAQFPEGLEEQSMGWMKEWFDNPIQIAGTTVTIPAEGKSAGNWGMKEP